MKRLTFDGNFCDIAMCQSVPGGSFCEDGYCSQKKVWERLKEYEDTGLEPGEIHKPAVSTYTNALIRYGEKYQTIVVIEELSECAKELCKVIRGQPDYDHLAEEIADAGIMLEQLVMIYSIGDSVRKFMDAKIKRLDDRLREEACHG